MRTYKIHILVVAVFTFLSFSSAFAEEVAIANEVQITNLEDKLPLDVQALPKLSLKQCVKLALDRNARLKASGYEIEAAKGQLIEASASFWPYLEYQYRMAPVPTDVSHALKDFFEGNVTFFNSLHIGVGVPVATFGQLSSAKKMAEGGVEAAKINSVKLRENTIHQVKQLYYGILFAKETIKLLENAVEKISDKISDEEAKEEKELDPYDTLQLKATRVDLERRLEEARNNLELAYDGLRIQLDLEPGLPIELDTDNLHPVLTVMAEEQKYVDAAMTSHPDVKLLDIGVETKRLQYSLEKFKLLPTAGIGFFVDIGRAAGQIKNLNITDDYNDPFNYTRAGVGLQFKGTIDFHGAVGRIKKSRAEYYKASYDRLVAKRALNLEVRKAYFAAKRAKEDVARAKKAESIAKQMIFLSKMNMDAGLGDSQKYGDALKFELLARGVYFKSVFDHNVMLSELSQKIGIAKADELFPALENASEYDDFESGGDEREYQTIEPARTTEEGLNYETGNIP